MEHSLNNVIPVSSVERMESILHVRGEQLRGYWRLQESESNKQDSRISRYLTETISKDSAREHPPEIMFNLKVGNSCTY